MGKLSVHVEVAAKMADMLREKEDVSSGVSEIEFNGKKYIRITFDIKNKEDSIKVSKASKSLFDKGVSFSVKGAGGSIFWEFLKENE